MTTLETQPDLVGQDGHVPVWRDPSRPVDDRVEALLRAMTPAEKVAQLGSAWEDVEPAGPEVAPGTSVLGVVGPLVETARDGLGQLTRPYGTVPRPALDHAAKLVERQQQVIAQNRLGIPAMAHDECLTGVTAFGATIYPTPLAMAATFDPALVQRVGTAIGTDLAEAGVHQGLAPVVDVIRDHRWGRCEETFGEDPELVGAMGEAYVRGVQSAGVIATLKHFVGYSASGGGRNHAPAHLGRRELFDVMLPPFARAVAGGVGSVMNSYADVDGDAPAASRHLLTRILRDTWGFEGTVVSDYWSIPFLVTAHRVAADDADAGRRALAAGMDVELPDQRGFGPRLLQSIERGEASEVDLDRSVRRVLRQKIAAGLLDPGWTPVPPGLAAGRLDLDKPTSRALAHEVAAASVVLLANDGALPLPTSGRVALIGPCADEARTMFGCYSFPNHVLSDRPELGNGVEALTFREALAAELPDVEWVFAPGCPVRDEDRSAIAAAVAAARDAEVVVLAVGDQPGMFGVGTSGEGCDVEDLRLPGIQEELVDAVLATGTPVILLVCSGRPYAIGRFQHAAAAIVQAFLPGEEGGAAVASLLSGRANFRGKLPVQIGASPGGQPHTYLHAPLGGKQSALSNLDPTPTFPFGHGLSYTRFEIGPATVDRSVIGVDEGTVVRVNVTNVGARQGVEVVQLYATDPVAQVTRPVRSLLAFTAVDLGPGDQATVEFAVHAEHFAFTGLDGELVVEPGAIELTAGSSSENISVPVTVSIEGDARFLLRRDRHGVPTTVRRDAGTTG